MFRLTAFLKRTDTIGRDAFLDHLVDIWGPAVAAGQKGLKKLLNAGGPFGCGRGNLNECRKAIFDR